MRLNQGISFPEAGKRLKPLVLVKSALAGGISFSDMQEKVIQKTGASSITNLGLATRQFSHFQR